jgi:hypothetical protein
MTATPLRWARPHFGCGERTFRSHVFAFCDISRRAAAVASAQNATSEDRFVKSKRSLDVGDGEKVRDGKPILRRHLRGFLLDFSG